jgi:hypothetical protein
MEKSGRPMASRKEDSRLWMEARGGFSLSTRKRKASRCCLSPSTSISTPWGEFITQPESCSSVASR